MKKIVRWGILGNAGIARECVIPALQKSTKNCIVAIASRGPLPNDLLPQARHYTDYDAMLNDSEVDAVYVPVPNALHALWSIRAMRKGKHVLCEKPLAVNPLECREMIRVAEENKVLLMEAFMYRYNSKMQKMLALLDAGAIGDVLGMQATHGFLLDWKSPARQDPALGGGCLFDVGCYCVDVMNLVMRRTDALPAEGSARFVMESGVDVHTSGLLRFTNGICGEFSCWFDSYPYQELSLFGKTGVLKVTDPFEENPGTILLINENGCKSIEIEGCNAYQSEVDAFADAVTGEANRVILLTDSLAEIEALALLYNC